MSVEWTISHTRKLVLAVAKGELTAADIERYLTDVYQQGAGSYAKIFNLADSTSLPSIEALQSLGVIAQKYATQSKTGPVAIVAPSDEAWRRAKVFDQAAKADRPLRIFRELHEASKWIEETRNSA